MLAAVFLTKPVVPASAAIAVRSPSSGWYVVNADDKRKARLNCIAHFLSVIPYKEIKHDKINLPPINKEGYVRPPITEQTFVPEVY